MKALRETAKEEAWFLYYTKGSLGELLTQTYIGIDIGYIDKESGLFIVAECKEIAAMIAALIKIRKGFVREEKGDYV
ncbi:TPA: four helix bundle protein, partial [Vibrio parahaemolyticus]